MSETLRTVIERASTDAAFRQQLKSNPEAALAGYGLTAEEKVALIRRSEAAGARHDGPHHQAGRQHPRRRRSGLLAEYALHELVEHPNGMLCVGHGQHRAFHL